MASSNTKQVAIVIGASRGIGRQVAIDLAKAGYAVVIAAKTRSNAYDSNIPFPPDPNSSSSTVDTVAREIRDLGHDALPLRLDVRDYEDVRRVVREAGNWRGRLDVLVYNSGAIWWSSVAETDMKRFKLMQAVNVEGLYGVVREVLGWMYRNGGENGDGEGRIVVISPPVYSRFLRGKTGYAMGKWGMSALTMGLAMDFVREGRVRMGITSLWPAVAIQSAATEHSPTADASSRHRDLRKPTIFSDAILSIVRAPVEDVSGKTFLDEDYLREHDGVTDFGKYAVVPGTAPRRIMPAVLPDLRVEEQDDEGVRMDSAAKRRRERERL